MPRKAAPAKTPANRKPIESRIKRLEEKMGKLNADKKVIEAKLADQSIYGAGQQAAPQVLVADQTYNAKELSDMEAQWLVLQEELEQLA